MVIGLCASLQFKIVLPVTLKIKQFTFSIFSDMEKVLILLLTSDISESLGINIFCSCFLVLMSLCLDIQKISHS